MKAVCCNNLEIAKLDYAVSKVSESFEIRVFCVLISSILAAPRVRDAGFPIGLEDDACDNEIVDEKPVDDPCRNSVEATGTRFLIVREIGEDIEHIWNVLSDPVGRIIDVILGGFVDPLALFVVDVADWVGDRYYYYFSTFKQVCQFVIHTIIAEQDPSKVVR